MSDKDTKTKSKTDPDNFSPIGDPDEIVITEAPYGYFQSSRSDTWIHKRKKR